MEVLLLEHAAACSSSPTADTAAQLDNSSSSSMLAVSAWCVGLHNELSGLFMSGSQGQLVAGGLQQYLASCGTPEQRSVSGLLAALRADCAGQQGCGGLFFDLSEMPGVCLCATQIVSGCRLYNTKMKRSHDYSCMPRSSLSQGCAVRSCCSGCQPPTLFVVLRTGLSCGLTARLCLTERHYALSC
jgi:hypothetical protein